jgi:hypothetical protein
MDKENEVYIHNGVLCIYLYSSIKKNEIMLFTGKMNGTGGMFSVICGCCRGTIQTNRGHENRGWTTREVEGKGKRGKKRRL